MPKAKFIMDIMKRCKGFHALTKNVKYLTAEKGNCTAEMKVGEEHMNPLGGLHGGFSATLVDVVSSMGLYTHKLAEKASVSVSLNITYLKGATLGDELFIESKTLSLGKSLAFLEVKIFNKNTMDLLVKGNHTKFLMGKVCVDKVLSV